MSLQAKVLHFYRKHIAVFCFSHRCEGICRLWTAGAKGIFSFAKENIPFGTPRERLLIGSFGLERLLCLRNGNACARRCRVSVAIRFASASIIRCRSAYLVGVQPNSRLPRHYSMRRAQQCRIRHAVCRQANVTRASRSKARLLDEPNRRGSWRSHVHRTRLRSACSSSSCNLPMSGSRGSALAFSWGIKRGSFSLVREWPPFSAPLHGAGIEARYRAAFYAVQQNCTGSVAALSHSSSSPLIYGEIAAKTLA